jgi:hypothetical protein
MVVKKGGKHKRSSEKTERQKAARASAAHLRDLRRAHRRPPPDVALASVAVPKRLSGEPVASYCSSPAQLCAELAQ